MFTDLNVKNVSHNFECSLSGKNVDCVYLRASICLRCFSSIVATFECTVIRLGGLISKFGERE